MTADEQQAIRQRLAELGADGERATRWALELGEQCGGGKFNLQTLLLFALAVAAGCRDGLPPDVVKEIEDLHRRVDDYTTKQINASRS